MCTATANHGHGRGLDRAAWGVYEGAEGWRNFLGVGPRSERPKSGRESAGGFLSLRVSFRRTRDRPRQEAVAGLARSRSVEQAADRLGVNRVHVEACRDPEPRALLVALGIEE